MNVGPGRNNQEKPRGPRRPLSEPLVAFLRPTREKQDAEEAAEYRHAVWERILEPEPKPSWPRRLRRLVDWLLPLALSVGAYTLPSTSRRLVGLPPSWAQ
jgi:hypothetical protein